MYENIISIIHPYLSVLQNYVNLELQQRNVVYTVCKQSDSPPHVLHVFNNYCNNAFVIELVLIILQFHCPCNPPNAVKIGLYIVVTRFLSDRMG